MCFAWIILKADFAENIQMPQTPPRKTPFLERREREFLYLHEVDALITALEKTRSPIRNQALALLLFCQALQPVELCWLRWCDISFVEKTLLVTRNRQKTTRYKGQQITVNLLLLCPPEIDRLQQLYPERTTDWVFASERKQRLSDRSLHHIIQNKECDRKSSFPSPPVYVEEVWTLLPCCYSGRQCGFIVRAMLFTLELAHNELTLHNAVATFVFLHYYRPKKCFLESSRAD